MNGSWDQEKLKALKEELDKEGYLKTLIVSKTIVVGTDGNNYEVTKDMIKIDMKTEKTSSKYFSTTQAPLISLYRNYKFYDSNQLNLAEALKRLESLACNINIP